MFENNLHDSVLHNIFIDWESGKVTIEITLCAGKRRTLVCRDIKLFEISRRHEWGPSVSINHAEVKKEGERLILRIEIQSGDVLQLECNGIAFLE